MLAITFIITTIIIMRLMWTRVSSFQLCKLTTFIATEMLRRQLFHCYRDASTTVPSSFANCLILYFACLLLHVIIQMLHCLLCRLLQRCLDDLLLHFMLQITIMFPSSFANLPTYCYREMPQRWLLQRCLNDQISYKFCRLSYCLCHRCSHHVALHAV